jgi:hypothetical protein
MKISRRLHRISLHSALAMCLLSSQRLLAQSPAPPVNVWTWHNDNGRTGQNAGETILKLTNVNKTSFGQLCSYPVDGQVYAQPLVLWDSARSRNLVYVVTQNDSIYVFDGTTAPVNKVCPLVASNTILIPAGETAVDCHNIGGKNCQTIAPTDGILGTPVVDENTNHIYLVTHSQLVQNGVTNYYHRIHALFTGLGGTTPLAEDTTYNSPQTISSGSFTPTFSALTHIERPGLLLLPGTQSPTPYVYVAFSMMDGATNYPPGFIFRYYGDNLSLPPVIYTTEPTANKKGGGIWMDGAGLAAGIDASGGSTFLYFTTADGDFDKNNDGSHCVDCGDSFVKLTYGLGMTSFFTPSDQACRFFHNNMYQDQDFGSGGVLLIPDSLLTSWPYLSVTADKNHNIWVMQRSSPGLYGGNSSCTGTNGNLETVAGTGVYHNTPAFWQNSASTGYLYYSSVAGSLKQYPVQSSCNPGAGNPPLCSSTAASADPSGSPLAFNTGTTPSISSNSTSDGIVWALSGMSVEGTTIGALYAFKAQDLTHIYDSNQCQGGADHMFSATSFSVPTIANGFVYVGAQSDNVTNVGKGTFYIFGKLATQRTSC